MNAPDTTTAPPPTLGRIAYDTLCRVDRELKATGIDAGKSDEYGELLWEKIGEAVGSAATAEIQSRLDKVKEWALAIDQQNTELQATVQKLIGEHLISVRLGYDRALWELLPERRTGERP